MFYSKRWNWNRFGKLALGIILIQNMEDLEMLLVGLFPQNEIKVKVLSDSKIYINVDGNKIKIKLPYQELLYKVMYPDVDFSKEYTHLIVDEIKKTIKFAR